MFKGLRSSSVALVAVLSIGGVCAAEPMDGGVDAVDGGVDGADEGAGAVDEGMDSIDGSDDWGEDAVWEEDGGSGFDAQGALSKMGVRIHGVFENQLQGMWLRNGNKNKGVVNNYTKLRVDLDATLAGDMTLRADGVARLFAGDTNIALKYFIPKGTREALLAEDSRWEPFFDEVYVYENDYYLGNAYLKVPIGPLSLVVGKQPLAQGVGYAWNPTDIFTQKDIFDPTYEKPGTIALRAVAAVGDKVTLDVVAVPDSGFKNWTGGGRAAVTAGPVRISAVAYVTRIKSQDITGSMDAMMTAISTGADPADSIVTHKGRRVMVGGEIVADIEGVRLWTEGAYNFIEDKEGLPSDYFEIVGGVEYFFRSETHVMAEYLHYGEGPKQRGGVYSYNDWMGVLDYSYKMLGRDFFFESIDHPVADFWTIGLSSFQSVSDASAAIMGDVKWQFREDAELRLLVSCAFGEQNDFFSSSRGQAWLRLTAFF